MCPLFAKRLPLPFSANHRLRFRQGLMLRTFFIAGFLLPSTAVQYLEGGTSVCPDDLRRMWSDSFKRKRGLREATYFYSTRKMLRIFPHLPPNLGWQIPAFRSPDLGQGLGSPAPAFLRLRRNFAVFARTLTGMLRRPL